MQTITVEVQALDEVCQDCPRLKINMRELYGNGRLIDRTFYCEHLDFCRDILGVKDDG